MEFIIIGLGLRMSQFNNQAYGAAKQTYHTSKIPTYYSNQIGSADYNKQPTTNITIQPNYPNSYHTSRVDTFNTANKHTQNPH